MLKLGMSGKRFNAATDASSQRQDDALRGYILGLSDSCPAAHDNPCDCPLFAVRKLCAQDRLIWLAALTKEDARYLAAYHHVCLGVRIESDQQS